MMQFCDFQRTLTLACAASGSFFVYGEQEAPELTERLRNRERIRAVLFETALTLDVWSMALSYDISVLFPSSLEELYRMLINFEAPVVIYVCGALLRMQEVFEISGYASSGTLNAIPADIKSAVSRGEIEQALLLYDSMEEVCGNAQVPAVAARGSRTHISLLKTHKSGRSDTCVVVTGYPSTMVYYLLEESMAIDTAYILGFNRSVMRELRLLAEDYRLVIWISEYETLCTQMLPRRTTRTIIGGSMHDIYESLMAILPKARRGELTYPGRPEEWPSKFLPNIPETEQRMCSGCIYRRQKTDAAYCFRLGIDVYRSRKKRPSDVRGADGCTGRYLKNNTEKNARRMIIGGPDEKCIGTGKLTYAIRALHCTGCGICVTDFGCPAICRDGLGYGIDTILCTGCGDCGDICEEHAIYCF